MLVLLVMCFIRLQIQWSDKGGLEIRTAKECEDRRPALTEVHGGGEEEDFEDGVARVDP